MIAEANTKLEGEELLALRGEIIICDDEPEICESLGMILERRGFDPLITHYGTECIRLAIKQRPRAILLDVNLPDVNGLDVCEQLSDAEQTRDIPIIVLTASGDENSVRLIRRHGGQFYLRKPCDPNTLTTVLERAMLEASNWTDQT